MPNSETTKRETPKGLPALSRSILRWGLATGVYLLAYAALIWASFLLRAPTGISPWYPAAGLGFALLVGFGVSYAPAFFIGTLIAGLWLELLSVAWPVTVVSVLIKTGGYTLGAVLLRSVGQFDPKLRRWRDLVSFLIVGTLTPLLIAALVIWNLTAAGLIPRSRYLEMVSMFWIGDMIGIMILTPFLLRVVLPWIERLGKGRGVRWPQAATEVRHLVRALLEGVVYGAIIALVLWIVFGSPLAGRFHLLYILFIPLLFIGLRHGLSGATTGILVLDVGAVLAMHLFSYRFESIGELQMFMLALSLGGLILGVVVSERRRIDAALRQSEWRYRTLYNRTPVMLQSVDPNGRIISVSDYWLEMMGYRRDEVIGRKCGDFLTETSRRYAEQVAGPAYRRSDWIENVPYQYVTQDGERIDILLSAARERDEDGEPLRSLEGLVDVTELKRAEKELLESEILFRRTFEAIPDPTILWRRQPDGRITLDRSNPAAFLMSEGRITEFLDAVVEDFFDESPDAVEQIKQTFDTGKTRRIELYHRLRTIDEERWLLADYVRASQDYVLNIVRDITEQKEAEAERERLIGELDAFAHTVAHDLKGPLAMVLGYATVLMENFVSMPPEELQSHLRAIAASGRRMSNIIDELLLLAGVRRIIEDVQARLIYLIEKSKAEIVLPEDWPEAVGHAPWVEEIWVNYISNAIEYGGDPPRVELGGERLPDGTARFWVRDNGQGLSEEAQSLLFAPFTQLHQVRARGHGLGLSIVRRIVEKLGGEVGVESEIGQGSTFWFTLPAAPDDWMGGAL